MKQEKEKKNDKILNMTKPIMTFLFIAGLLILALALHSTTLIFDMPIISKMAFAQQQTPTGIICKVRTLLSQTLNEYRNQNFTGAQSLATSAYLDHFEFIEAPLEKHDIGLKNDTEMMLREQLRQMIKDKAHVDNIQQLINKININLDKAERLLSNELPIQTITSAVSSANQTNLTTNSSYPVRSLSILEIT